MSTKGDCGSVPPELDIEGYRIYDDCIDNTINLEFPEGAEDVFIEHDTIEGGGIFTINQNTEIFKALYRALREFMPKDER